MEEEAGMGGQGQREGLGLRVGVALEGGTEPVVSSQAYKAGIFACLPVLFVCVLHSLLPRSTLSLTHPLTQPP